MNILRIIATVDARTGGPIEGLVRSSAAMRRLGHTVEVATLDEPEMPWVVDFPFPVHALGPRMRAYGYARRFTPWLKANLKAYDAVILHGVWNYTSFGAWRALRSAETPYCIFTHGSLDPWHRQAYPLKDAFKQLYWLVVEGPVLRDARYVLFTTEEERRLARRAYLGRQGYRERVIAYGTADAPAATRDQTEAFLAQTGLHADDRYLLFLSRIHPKKGVDLLIRAFAEAASGDAALRLVIAGPDQTGWQADLVALAKELCVADRIVWPGMLEGDAKWGAYRNAAAFVLPSHGENFGIVVAEALACGTPVVISNKINIWREIDIAGAGIVADNTSDDTSRALSEFLSKTDQQRAAMGAAGRQLFLERFDVEHSARDILKALA